ncbi:F-box protein [Platanthera guangdongensis]|uniref:F-box protein n=1 Tax=Platanthera guangdongensis TaxID=2320717 RepID=A0ABR2MEN7_9ASPA
MLEAEKFVMVTKAHLFKATFLASKERNLRTHVLFFQRGEYHAELCQLVLCAFVSYAISAKSVWKEVASDREVREWAFREPWKVQKLLSSPSSTSFWSYPGLNRFAISHRLLRGDTVTILSLKYSVQFLNLRAGDRLREKGEAGDLRRQERDSSDSGDRTSDG